MAGKATKPLTPKQIKFIKAKASGKSGEAAAMEAYNVKTPEAARVIASQNLTKLNLREALDAEMHRQGITLELAIKPITDALADDTLDNRLKGSDRALKLMGAFQNNNEGSTSIHFHSHQSNQREIYGL